MIIMCDHIDDLISCRTIDIDAYQQQDKPSYEGWNFNSGNYLFTTDTK